MHQEACQRLDEVNVLARHLFTIWDVISDADRAGRPFASTMGHILGGPFASERTEPCSRLGDRLTEPHTQIAVGLEQLVILTRVTFR